MKNYQGFKGFGALRLKLYLELLFRILKIILRFNFKYHFEPEATKKVKKPHPRPLSKGRGEYNPGFKGFGALRLKMYLELLFRILKKILRFNFKLHFEPQATKKVKKPHPRPLSKGRGE